MNGQDIGYIRVSTIDQSTDRQLDGVAVDKTFIDKCSGKSTERPALQECLDYIRAGDTLHVHSIDRLARNLVDLEKLVSMLTVKGVNIVFHKESLQMSGTETAMQKLFFQLLGAFAEFERSLIRERQREGIAIAKTKGVFKGRKPKLDNEQVRCLIRRHDAGERACDLAKEYGISRQAAYRYFKKHGAI